MNAKELQKRIAGNLRKLRRKAGWTQENMREKGYNIRYYQKIEAGEVNMTLEMLVRLANTHGCDPRELVK